MKKALSILILFVVFSTNGQTSETPLENYQWKRGKTKQESGFVVLKSGKRLDGTISLKGSVSKVTEIVFEGDGKKIEFPAAALKSFGLLNFKTENTSTQTAQGPINDSPESMYEWRSKGTVMGKEITGTVPREGYVVLKNGTRYEGELRLTRKDGVLTSYKLKADKKYKGKISDLERYGYTVSEDEVAQQNLNKLAKNFYQGTIKTNRKECSGEVAQVNIMGKFYSKKILHRDVSGKLTEFTPKDVTTFSQKIKGELITYTVRDGVFVTEQFNGNTFQLFRNPNPTTTNAFLTGLVKEGAAIGTNALAQAAVKKDAKDNNYTTNMDSIIRVSTPEQLMAIRDGFAKLGGYNTYQEALDKSDNESLKNNINAIEFALAGNEIKNSEGGIFNKEWIILNKTTGEETVIYKSEYKKLIEPLLKGCYEYLSLERKEQRFYEKWNNREAAIKMLDGCY